MPPLQTDEIRYDIMVERLFPDYQPAKLLWPVHKRLVLWLALEFGIVVAGFAVHRPDLLQRLRSTQYLLELGAFLAMGTGAAVLALRTAIPGCEPNRYELSVILIVALTGIGLIACEHSIMPVSLAHFIRGRDPVHNLHGNRRSSAVDRFVLGSAPRSPSGTAVGGGANRYGDLLLRVRSWALVLPNRGFFTFFDLAHAAGCWRSITFDFRCQRLAAAKKLNVDPKEPVSLRRLRTPSFSGPANDAG
jgi:Negative regulator of sigma F